MREHHFDRFKEYLEEENCDLDEEKISYLKINASPERIPLLNLRTGGKKVLVVGNPDEL